MKNMVILALVATSSMDAVAADSKTAARIPASAEAVGCAGKIGWSVTIDGTQAKKLALKINDDPNVQRLENTTSKTVNKLDNITCTLYGSHGGAEKARGGEMFICDIEL